MNTSINIYKIDPDYRRKVSIKDPRYLVHVNAFTVRPLFNIGLKGGPSFNQVAVDKYYLSSGQDEIPSYTRKWGFHLGFTADMLLYKGLYVSIEPLFDFKRIEKNQPLFEYATLSYNERLYYGQLPVSFKYEIGNRGIRPFLRVGYVPGYLMDARADISRTELNGSSVISEANKFQTTAFRTRFNSQIMAGVGANVGIGKLRFLLEIRYAHSLNALPKEGNRLLTHANHQHSHIDDQFKLHTLEISFGVLFQTFKITQRSTPKAKAK